MATTDALAADLRSFTPTGNEYDDVEKLRGLITRWAGEPEAARAALLPLVFGIFERNPDNAEMGIPGPVVHALEEVGGYEQELAQSLRRMPSHYGLWMANRILNALEDERERAPWMDLLRQAAKDARISSELRDEAGEFLEFQEE